MADSSYSSPEELSPAPVAQAPQAPVFDPYAFLGIAPPSAPTEQQPTQTDAGSPTSDTQYPPEQFPGMVRPSFDPQAFINEGKPYYADPKDTGLLGNKELLYPESVIPAQTAPVMPQPEALDPLNYKAKRIRDDYMAGKIYKDTALRQLASLAAKPDDTWVDKSSRIAYETAKGVASTATGMALAPLGASAGAIAGTAIAPGPGTFVGGAAGGMLAFSAGSHGMDKLIEAGEHYLAGKSDTFAAGLDAIEKDPYAKSVGQLLPTAALAVESAGGYLAVNKIAGLTGVVKKAAAGAAGMVIGEQAVTGLTERRFLEGSEILHSGASGIMFGGGKASEVHKARAAELSAQAKALVELDLHEAAEATAIAAQVEVELAHAADLKDKADAIVAASAATSEGDKDTKQKKEGTAPSETKSSGKYHLEFMDGPVTDTQYGNELDNHDAFANVAKKDKAESPAPAAPAPSNSEADANAAKVAALTEEMDGYKAKLATLDPKDWTKEDAIKALTKKIVALQGRIDSVGNTTVLPDQPAERTDLNLKVSSPGAAIEEGDGESTGSLGADSLQLRKLSDKLATALGDQVTQDALKEGSSPEEAESLGSKFAGKIRGVAGMISRKGSEIGSLASRIDFDLLLHQIAHELYRTLRRGKPIDEIAYGLVTSNRIKDAVIKASIRDARETTGSIESSLLNGTTTELKPLAEGTPAEKGRKLTKKQKAKIEAEERTEVADKIYSVFAPDFIEQGLPEAAARYVLTNILKKAVGYKYSLNSGGKPTAETKQLVNDPSFVQKVQDIYDNATKREIDAHENEPTQQPAANETGQTNEPGSSETPIQRVQEGGTKSDGVLHESSASEGPGRDTSGGTDASPGGEQQPAGAASPTASAPASDLTVPSPSGSLSAGPGAGHTSEFAENPQETTSLSKEAIAAAREKRGLSPEVQEARRADPETMEAAETVLDNNENAGYEIVERLLSGDGRANEVDKAVLLLHIVQLQNRASDESARVADTYASKSVRATAKIMRDRAEAELFDAEKAAGIGGSIAGRLLRFQRVILNRDYTLGAMLSKLRKIKDGPLTDTEKSKVEELVNKLEDAQKRLDEFEKAKKDSEPKDKEDAADQAVKDAALDAAKTDPLEGPIHKYSQLVLDAAERFVNAWDNAASAAEKRIAARRAQGKLLMSLDPLNIPGLIDHIIIGTAALAKHGMDLAKWTAKMVDTFGDEVRPLLPTIYRESKLNIDTFRMPDGTKGNLTPKEKAQAKKVVARKVKAEQSVDNLLDGMKTRLSEGDKIEDLSGYIRKIAMHLIRSGTVASREPLLDALHERVKEVVPDMDRSKLMDLFSGYGEFEEFSKDKDKITYAQWRGEVQKIRQIQDLQAALVAQQAGKSTDGMGAKPTGRGRVEESNEYRRLGKVAGELRRQLNIKVDPKKHLKTALDATKTRLRNEIKDMDYAIANKQPIVSKDSTVVYDAEATQLKAEREAKKAEYDALFPKAGPSEATRVAKVIGSLDKTINGLQEQINSGRLYPEQTDSAPLTSPEIAERKAKIESLRAERENLRNLDTAKVEADKASALRKQIADLNQKITEGATPASKDGTPTVDSPEIAALKAERDAKTKEYLSHRPPLSEAEQVAKVLASIDRSKEKIEQQIRSGRLYPQDKASRRLSYPEIAQKKLELEALRDERNVLRDLDTARVEKDKADKLEKQIADLSQKIADGAPPDAADAPAPTVDSPEIATLKDQLQSLRNQHSEMFPQDGESQIAAEIKRLDKNIKDMEDQVRSGRLYPETKESKELNSVEISQRKAKLKELRAERENLRNNSPEKIERDKAKRIDQLDKLIKQKEAKIAARDLSVAKNKKGPESPEISAREAKLAELNKELATLRLNDEVRAIEAYKANATKQIAALNKRLSDKDYAPRPKKVRDIKHDEKSRKLEAEVGKLRMDLKNRLAEEQLKKRNYFQKVTAFLAQMNRANVLGHVSVLEHLSGAAMGTVVSGPIARTFAQLMRITPWTSSVLRKAIYEGGYSWKAQKASMTANIKSFGAVMQKLKTGKSELDFRHSDGKAYPKEFMAWVGHVHAMIKEPVRQGLYAYSMQLRLLAAESKGLDPANDPVLRSLLSHAAFTDANRDIMMGDNILTQYLHKAVGAGLRSTKLDSRVASFAADVMDVLFPVVNVPVNIMIRGLRLKVGFAEGLGRLALAAKNGELANNAETLSERDAEVITRCFKYGLFGLAMSYYAWTHDDKFGGVRVPGYKALPPEGDADLQPGEVLIGGHVLSHHLAHDSTWTTMNEVAAAKRLYKQEIENNPDSPWGALSETACFMLFAQARSLPILNTGANLLSTFKTGADKVGDIVRNMFIFGGIQDAAVGLDPAEGRKAHGVVEQVQKGIPFAREYLDEK